MISSSAKIKILFVCLGNICRSPTAQGVLEKLLSEKRLQDRFIIDSAGCHDYHAGEPPDRRAIKAAALRGIDISTQRARKIEIEDFQKFDFIFAMDKENLRYLKKIAPKNSKAEIKLFLDYAPELNTDEVPDPYYGGSEDFERVLNLLEVAGARFIDSFTIRE